MTKLFKTQLTIFQQEGYSPSRFLSWWWSHPLAFQVSQKKPLVITPKVKTLLHISFAILSFLLITSISLKNYPLGIISLLIYFVAPFLYFFLSTLSLLPYEKINKERTVSKVRETITSRPDLTTIGITGSYGKTSVKDFLYVILSGWQETVKTPESYNTVFGIAKVVNLELLSKTKIFICEMGAYFRGEIRQLSHMVPPRYSILTAIGSQHLERFKKIENTTLAKFELVDATANKANTLVNIDNPHIAAHLIQSKYRYVKTYSLHNPKADFYLKDYSLSANGATFTITHKNKNYQYNSSLFGTSNLYNLVAAISMSMILKVPEKIISKQVAKITPSPHRLELKRINQATLIDNAFSSNEEGFTAIISDLSRLKGKKVLITPGIIELGNKTEQVHKKLGELAAPVFDKFILVGKSPRTTSLEQGLTSKQSHCVKIEYIPNSTNLWPLIEEQSKDYDWILLENDLPDNF